jgi:hypothetical protein
MKPLTLLTAILAALFLGGCGMEERVPAEMVSVAQSQPLSGEKSLSADIRFDIGSLEIAAEKSSSAYSMDLEYDKAFYEPQYRFEPGTEGRFSLKLSGIRKVGLRTNRDQNRLRVNFSNTLPLKLDVNSGVGETRLALSGLKLEKLNLEFGVGGSKVSSYEANPIVCDSIRIKNGVGGMDAVGLGNLNFRDFEFEGGVGGASLDFTGAWKQNADIKVQVGVGGINMKLPRDLGVRVEAEKHFLSGLHLEGFSRHDSYYYSENYDKAKIRVTVRVTTGVGGFRITWV